MKGRVSIVLCFSESTMVEGRHNAVVKRTPENFVGCADKTDVPVKGFE